MPDYDIIVIGAGVGGLTAGSICARRGRKVLVLEQSDRIGGCCSTYEKEGYRFDVGASIVEEIQPIELAFEALGTTFQEEVDLIPCDPMMEFMLPDGTHITYPVSVEATGEVISRFSPEDGKSWFKFAEYFKGLTKIAMEGFFVNPASSLTDMARIMAKTPGLLKYASLFTQSYQDVITKYFKSEEIQSTMSYQSLYVGLPPELTAGLYATIPYSEHEGIWYPRGGMIRIPEAFRRMGEKNGMDVRTGALVKKVLVRDRRVRGVVLDDGTEITSDLVISNINAKTLYLDMIGEDQLPWLARYGMKSYGYSKSVAMLYVGVDYEPPLEAHHGVVAFPLKHMNDYWWNNVQKGVLPEHTTGLICWPTHEDPSLAPEGHHILSIIPECFYHLSGTDWDREKQSFIEKTIEDLSRNAVPGLADHVKMVDCATPLDFERRLLLPEGAIYDLQQDLASTIMFRPSARSRSIKGLYLAGNSTHPGGGVPLVVASGLIAANLVERYE
jgi:phytoene desaturase